MLAAVLALLALINLELFEKSLSGMQILLMGSAMVVVGLGLTVFFARRSAEQACPRFDLVDDVRVLCQVQSSDLNFSNLGVAYAADSLAGDLDVSADGAGSALLRLGTASALTAEKLVVLGEQGQAIPWTDSARQDWEPQTLEQINLVVCVGQPREERLEVCSYGGGINLGRFRQVLPARLVLAPTGETLAAGEISADPPPCQPMGLQNLLRLHARVEYNDLKAWVNQALGAERSSKVLASPTPVPATPTLAPTPTQTPAPTPTPQVTGEIKTNARLRAGPGQENVVINGLLTGEPVIILGANSERTWLYVLTPNGEEGWVFAELVKLPVPLEQIPLKP